MNDILKGWPFEPMDQNNPLGGGGPGAGIGNPG